MEGRFLEWGQAPKPPSFVALRATTQSARQSLESFAGAKLRVEKHEVMVILEVVALAVWKIRTSRVGRSLPCREIPPVSGDPSRVGIPCRFAARDPSTLGISLYGRDLPPRS